MHSNYVIILPNAGAISTSAEFLLCYKRQRMELYDVVVFSFVQCLQAFLFSQIRTANFEITLQHRDSVLEELRSELKKTDMKVEELEKVISVIQNQLKQV